MEKMKMLLGVLMVLASGSFGAPLTPINISVDCDEAPFLSGGISLLEFAPGPLAALTLSLSVEDGWNMLNISWAIAVDSTAKYIEATEIVTGQGDLRCEYVPSFPEAIRQGLIHDEQEQLWFSHKFQAFSANYYVVQAANLPLPPEENGLAYIYTTLYNIPTASPKKPVASPKEPLALEDSNPPDMAPPEEAVPRSAALSPLLLSIGAGSILALTLLIFGLVTYKRVRWYLSVGLQKASAGPRVPVLLVYPAEGAVFQAAVVALAEFLQEHAGCRVEVDVWSQGSVANLGPLRWLHEQLQATQRLLIVAPQPCPPPCPVKSSFPGVSAPPAAAQDLFPLALNLVAARARNGSELAKVWVVRFGERERERALTAELQACRSFCLMKDLNKLCRGLQTADPNRTADITDLLLRRADFSGGNRAERLRAAVQALHPP